jgi:hypothetical protein
LLQIGEKMVGNISGSFPLSDGDLGSSNELQEVNSAGFNVTGKLYTGPIQVEYSDFYKNSMVDMLLNPERRNFYNASSDPYYNVRKFHEYFGIGGYPVFTAEEASYLEPALNLFPCGSWTIVVNRIYAEQRVSILLKEGDSKFSEEVIGHKVPEAMDCEKFPLDKLVPISKVLQEWKTQNRELLYLINSDPRVIPYETLKKFGGIYSFIRKLKEEKGLNQEEYIIAQGRDDLYLTVIYKARFGDILTDNYTANSLTLLESLFGRNKILSGGEALSKLCKYDSQSKNELLPDPFLQAAPEITKIAQDLIQKNQLEIDEITLSFLIEKNIWSSNKETAFKSLRESTYTTDYRIWPESQKGDIGFMQKGDFKEHIIQKGSPISQVIVDFRLGKDPCELTLEETYALMNSAGHTTTDRSSACNALEDPTDKKLFYLWPSKSKEGALGIRYKISPDLYTLEPSLTNFIARIYKGYAKLSNQLLHQIPMVDLDLGKWKANQNSLNKNFN